MKNITVIILFLLYMPEISVAQDWFSEYRQGEKLEGYIIGIAGDTIRGYIRYDYPVVMQKRVEFYPRNEVNNKKIYKPEDIRGYHVGERQWEPIRVMMETYNGVYKFNRFGILQTDGGIISLYRVFEEKDKLKKRVNSEEAEKQHDDIALHPEKGSLGNIYIKKRDNPAEPVFTKDFKRSFIPKMQTYVGNYDKLMTRIQNKDLELEDLNTIVAEYNQWASAKRRY